MLNHNNIELLILEYMVKGGQDSLEGIAQWWLLEQTIIDETLRVEVALERLMQEGLVASVRGADLKVRYRIVPDMRERICQLLEEEIKS